MPQPLVKLVVALLLIVQGAVALVPGQVLCIPVQDCDSHELRDHAACDHCEADAFGHGLASDACGTHEHGPVSATTHPAEDCGCHLHLPVPDSEPARSNVRTDLSDVRSIALPVLVACLWTWHAEPERASTPVWTSLPDFFAMDQVLALKSTRLLI
jgi:hypothetical protein